MGRPATQPPGSLKLSPESQNGMSQEAPGGQGSSFWLPGGHFRPPGALLELILASWPPFEATGNLCSASWGSFSASRSGFIINPNWFGLIRHGLGWFRLFWAGLGKIPEKIPGASERRAPSKPTHPKSTNQEAKLQRSKVYVYLCTFPYLGRAGVWGLPRRPVVTRNPPCTGRDGGFEPRRVIKLLGFAGGGPL